MDFLDIVFNELSLQTPAADISTARQWMSEFIDTIRAVKPAPGIKRKLRTRSDFFYSFLAPNYPIVKWLNDPDVDLEARRFLKGLQDKNDLWLQDIADPGIEVRYQGKQAIGLDYAFVFNAIALSLISDPEWDCSRLELEVTPVDENEELVTTNESIIHASRSDHAREHADWIEKRTRKEIRNGLDLWQRRGVLFPHLLFCDAVEKQLQSLLTEDPMLWSVEERLSQLENASQTWISGAVDQNTIPCKTSLESESRLKKFSQELTIKCPDEKERLFSWHVRMTPGAWRLHFCTELGPGKIIIGYIGPKIK
jgi:hypothetical protein